MFNVRTRIEEENEVKQEEAKVTNISPPCHLNQALEENMPQCAQDRKIPYPQGHTIRASYLQQSNNP